jgi:GNAT superfamily N-acetyltransferase
MIPHLHRSADPLIVEAWTKGWSLARGVKPPVRYEEGFRVEVGWPEQAVRYVFPRITDAFLQLAETIHEPWHFLKVCAPPETVSAVLPSRWELQQTRFMMTCFTPMPEVSGIQGDKYATDMREEEGVTIASILSEDGEVAAIGRIVFADGFAIYDRIETHPAHRRRKLGSQILKTLESAAASRGITKGVLVATAEGKLLYEKLGWQLLSVYSTAVIKG